MESSAGEAAADLGKTDASLQAAERHAEKLESARRSFVSTWLIAVPAGIAVVLGLLLFGLGATVLKGKVFFLVQMALGVAVLYGGFVYGKLWKGLFDDLTASARKLKEASTEKKRLVKRLEEGYATPLTMRYERDLLGAQRSFLEELIQHVARARRHLDDFVNHMSAFSRDAEDERRRILVPNTPFVRSAVTWEEVDRWLSGHPRFRIEARAVFKEISISDMYTAFTQTNSLARLRVVMQETTERMFGYLKEMTLEDILVEMNLLPEGPGVARLKGCFDQAKAFISLDAEDVMDESATLVFALMTRSPFGYIEDILSLHSITEPSFYYSGDKQSLIVYRLKAGFPAFLMSPVRFCRAALNRLPDRPMYFTDPLGRLPSVFPTSYTVGDVDDEIRQIVCLGQAFGFLQEYNGGWWMNGQKLADSYEDLGEYLRRMAAAPVREDMRRMVLLCKAESGAVFKLSSYLRGHAVERIDHDIIETTIRELSPLE
ncbi:MAG: hypothetical protein FJX76_06350 [Armatimonadetes bacterium]|nr:hypothetical protein [Armatimonadota bacterium]